MMGIVRLLHRFIKRKVYPSEALLMENPLIKLSVLSGVMSPTSVYQPTNEPPSISHHSVHTQCSLALEPCFQEGSTLDREASEQSTAHGGLFDWDGLLWGVPKKRTSHSKKRMRMTHKYLKPKHHYTVCPNCNNLKLLHVLCGHCLKETLRQTAAMRRAQINQQLELGDADKDKHESTSAER